MNHFLMMLQLLAHLDTLKIGTAAEAALVLQDMRKAVPPEQLVPQFINTRNILLSKIDAGLEALKSAADTTDIPRQAPKAKAPRKAAKPAKAAVLAT